MSLQVQFIAEYQKGNKKKLEKYINLVSLYLILFWSRRCGSPGDVAIHVRILYRIVPLTKIDYL